MVLDMDLVDYLLKKWNLVDSSHIIYTMVWVLFLTIQMKEKKSSKLYLKWEKNSNNDFL